MGRRNISRSYLDESSYVEDEWEHEGISNHDEWAQYGFTTPDSVHEWTEVVGSPEEARFFVSNRISPRDAEGWLSMEGLLSPGYRMEDAIAAVNGDLRLALAYHRHFDISDWGYLRDANVVERATAPAFQLATAIETRNIDRGEEADRESVIYEAAVWLSHNAHYRTQRTSLLQTLILSGMKMQDVKFTLADEDSYPSANAAIKANFLLREAGYVPDAEGMAAYKLLVQFKDIMSSEFHALASTYGVRRLVVALDAGLSAPEQIAHYLEHGGVAEIARGVL